MMTSIKKNLQRVFFTTLALYTFLGGGGMLIVSAQAALPDPGGQGLLAVSGKQYIGPDIFLSQFPGPVEQLAVVWHPTNMGSNVFPLVIFLHGRHFTCFAGTQTQLVFPCPAGFEPIPNYRGYDYLAQNLASHGYIVVSISANGINVRDDATSDRGALARAQLIQRHLDIWRAFNDGSDPWGGIFRGRVNLNNVGTMGHSRGGEGVVRHFLLNTSAGSPYRIRAVLPLAPVDFNRSVINGVPLGVLLPYCDGDVSDLQGVHYYDDARYNVTNDPAPKHTFLVLGANHNFYNTVWTPELFSAGASDDWLSTPGATTDPHCGSFGAGKRLTAAQQRSTALAYIQAFFRIYIGNRTEFLPYLKGDAPPPPSAQTSQISVSYHPAATQRRSVNRLLSNTNLTTNNLGGSVSRSGLTPYRLCGGDAPQPQHCLPDQPFERQPHTAPSSFSAKRGLSQLHLGWTNSAARYANQVPPESSDVSSFDRLQFRAGLDFTSPNNRFSTQDLSVVLIDAAGHQVSAPVSAHSRVLFFPPGNGTVEPTPKVVLNTVRIPLSAFGDVDLHNIRAVRLDFNRQSSGALLISDLMFAR